MKKQIIAVLIAVSIAVNIVSFIRPGPLVDIIYQVLFKEDMTHVYFNTGLDQFLAKYVAEGNLFIKFKGYGSLNKESDTPLLIYMRAYYTLYPRKVYVVKPGIVVR